MQKYLLSPTKKVVLKFQYASLLEGVLVTQEIPGPYLDLDLVGLCMDFVGL